MFGLARSSPPSCLILESFLFGLYLGRSSVTSAYGAAGSLVVVLFWVYYSAQNPFFGAKFTQIYSDRYGSHLEPVSGAEAVTLKVVVVSDSEQRRPVV